MSASNKQVGQHYGLYLVTAESPETDVLVACLNNKEFSIDAKVIDATSDCGPDFLKGFTNSKVTGKGFIAFDDDTVESGPSMLELAKLPNSTGAKNWKIAPADPVTGDQVLTFTGFVNAYKETMNTDQAIEFDFGIQVQGDITQQVF